MMDKVLLHKKIFINQSHRSFIFLYSLRYYFIQPSLLDVMIKQQFDCWGSQNKNDGKGKNLLAGWLTKKRLFTLHQEAHQQTFVDAMNFQFLQSFFISIKMLMQCNHVISGQPQTWNSKTKEVLHQRPICLNNNCSFDMCLAHFYYTYMIEIYKPHQ